MSIINAIFQAISTAGICLGIIAFFCFCLLLIGAIIRITMDALEWIFK